MPVQFENIKQANFDLGGRLARIAGVARQEKREDFQFEQMKQAAKDRVAEHIATLKTEEKQQLAASLLADQRQAEIESDRALRIMQSPEFETLPPEQQQVIRMHTMAKDLHDFMLSKVKEQRDTDTFTQNKEKTALEIDNLKNPKPTGDLAAFQTLYPKPEERTPANFFKFKQGQLAPQARPSVEQQEMDAWLAKPENKGKTAVDFGDYKANRGKTPDEGTSITDQSLDMLATQYAKTGQLPALGMGNAAAGDRRRIFNRAAQLFPAIDVATNAAEFNANKGSLNSLQKGRDAIVAFENTANKNLDQFLTTAKGVVDKKSPVLNKPLRSIDRRVLGSDEQAAFDAARRIAVNEIAKVTSNPNLSGQLSDSARHEVESFIPEDATIEQIYSVAKILKADMKNRHVALDEQIADINKRLKGTTPKGRSDEKTGADSIQDWTRDANGKLVPK